jgi:hypothetical protein
LEAGSIKTRQFIRKDTVAPARHKPSCLPGNGFGKSGTWLSELRTWARVFLLFFCWWPQFFRNLRVIWPVV